MSNPHDPSRSDAAPVAEVIPATDHPMADPVALALGRLMAISETSEGTSITDEIEKANRLRWREKLRAAANLPERAVRVLSGPGQPDWWQRMWLLAENRLRKKPGAMLALHGMQGRGKTVFACAWALDYLDRGKSARFIDLLELEELYDAARGPVEGDDRDALEFTTENSITVGLGREGPALLIIDECGKSRATDYVMRKFFLLVNQRYNADLDTIFISNLPEKEFADWLGSSLTDRINEDGGLMEFKGEGLR